MSGKLRSFVKDFIPPIVGKIYRKLMPRKVGDITWTGNYNSWQQAKQNCTGYDMPMILQKTKEAVLKVNAGQAAFERDTILFYEPEYNWVLLSILFKAAAENNGNLSVLDFGGSLGSTYFQHLTMLKSLPALQWSVVEQEAYIEVGNELIADGNLQFYKTPQDCIKDRKPNVLLLSSVLQYIEQPYALLNQLLSVEFDYVIISRTTVTDYTDDHITIQNVPESIYKASYPAWFFNVDKLLKVFEGKYDVITDFNSYPGYTFVVNNEHTGHYHDFILKKI